MSELSYQSETAILRLRPHHILCLPFINLDENYPHKEFLDVLIRIKGLLTSELDVKVTVVEGADEICCSCPSCVEGRCESLPVQEDMVRKIDEFLLREIGKSYGEMLVVDEWRTLISDNWPYRLCRRCRWKAYCNVQVI